MKNNFNRRHDLSATPTIAPTVRPTIPKTTKPTIQHHPNLNYYRPQFALKSEPYIPSYYNQSYGLYYDSFKQPRDPSMQIPFVVGAAYSILTNLLNAHDDEIISDYVTSVASWEERFKQVKDEVFKAFQINNEQKWIPKAESGYSTVYFWEDENTNSGMLYGQNICYSPSSAEIFLYFPHGNKLDTTILGENFRWGWSIRQYHTPLFSFKPYSNSGTVLTFPPFRNHIYHAVEGMGLLLHNLFSAEDFPYTADVINTGLSKKDVPWIQELIAILMDSYPLSRRPKLYTSDSIFLHPGYANNQICFDEVLIMDRMRQGGDGGFLSGFLGTDWVRSLVYKTYQLEPQPFNQTRYQLLFVQRSNTRKWVDPYRYIHAISNRFGKRINVVSHVLSAAPLKKQVGAFYRAQIVLSPHGAGLTNAMFMLPHSVVIEVTPPHFTEFCLANVILHARLHYIYIPNFDYTVLKSKQIQYPDNEYNHGNYSKIRSLYKSLDLTTSLFSILCGVQDAVEYLDHYQAKRVNDVLSPIFI